MSIIGPQSPTAPIMQSYYDNVSPSNIIVTNVSVNLQQPRKAVGVVKTRVVASTLLPTHPTPTAPSSSQFSTLEVPSKIPTKSEKQFQSKFVKLYGNRKAPIVPADSETEDAAPKDPKPSLNERKHSFESILSTDSRESVVSATSFRAENKVRRYFNY